MVFERVADPLLELLWCPVRLRDELLVDPRRSQSSKDGLRLPYRNGQLTLQGGDHGVHGLVSAGQLGPQQSSRLRAVVGGCLEDHDHAEVRGVQAAQPAGGAAEAPSWVRLGEHLRRQLARPRLFQPALADQRENLALGAEGRIDGPHRDPGLGRNRFHAG